MNVFLPPSADPRLLRACHYVLRNTRADLSLARLAAVAFLSPFHFLRRFKRELHETPHQFVIRVRLEKAKELLAGDSLSVTDIGAHVGFRSMGSFSRLFHSAVGWSPSTYRARVWALRAHPGKFIPGCYVQQFGFTQVSNSR